MRKYSITDQRIHEIAESLISEIAEVLDDPIQDIEYEDINFDEDLLAEEDDTLYFMSGEDIVEAVRDMAIDDYYTLMKWHRM